MICERLSFYVQQGGETGEGGLFVGGRRLMLQFL